MWISKAIYATLLWKNCGFVFTLWKSGKLVILQFIVIHIVSPYNTII